MGKVLGLISKKAIGADLEEHRCKVAFTRGLRPVPLVMTECASLSWYYLIYSTILYYRYLSAFG